MLPGHPKLPRYIRWVSQDVDVATTETWPGPLNVTYLNVMFRHGGHKAPANNDRKKDQSDDNNMHFPGERRNISGRISVRVHVRFKHEVNF